MDEKIKEDLRKIFLNNFQNLNAENFDFNQSRSDFENWDSLAHMQIISEVEEFFKINFEMDEIININKPEDLLALVEKKKNA